MSNQINNQMGMQMGKLDVIKIIQEFIQITSYFADFQNQIVPNIQQQQNPNLVTMPQLTLQTPQTPNLPGVGSAVNAGAINPQQKEFNVLSLCRVSSNHFLLFSKIIFQSSHFRLDKKQFRIFCQDFKTFLAF